MQLRRRLLAVLTLVVATAATAAVSSCAVVRPWERARLATQVMTRGASVEEAMIERTFLEAREGASGGSAVGAGGGCACN
jgi:hypothetical protein